MIYAPSVTIAIVNFNTRDALRDCLKSIERVRDEVQTHVVVVDNASTDGSLAMLEYEFPEIKVLANTENIGFARAVNQAFEQATTDYLFLLNPDTWLAKKALVRLIEMAERDPAIAVVGAQLTSFDGESQQSVLGKPGLLKEVLNLFPELKAILLPQGLKRMLLRRRERKQGQITVVPAVSGGALLVRSEAFKQVGGMDPRFFVYHEEVDLCLRFQKSGRKIVFAPLAQVLHIDALATGYKTNRLPPEPVLSWRLQGLSILFEKHYSPGQHKMFLRMASTVLTLRAAAVRVSAAFVGSRSESYRARADELAAAAVRIQRSHVANS